MQPSVYVASTMPAVIFNSGSVQTLLHILQQLQLMVVELKPQPTHLHVAEVAISMVSKVSCYHKILQGKLQ